MTTHLPSSAERSESPSRSSGWRNGLICALALILGIIANRSLRQRSVPDFPAYLQARITTVMSDREAAVVALQALEGDHVTLTTPLLTLRDRSLERQIRDQMREVATLESQLQQALAQARLELLMRTREIDEEILQSELLASNYLREQFACELEHSMLADVISDTTLASLWVDADPVFRSTVLESPLTGVERAQSVLRLELMANSAEVLAAQVDMCDRRREHLIQLKDQLPETVERSSGVQTIESRLAAARVELEALQQEQLTLVIPASAIGIVGLYRVTPGSAVETGTPLVDILDDQARYLVAHIPSRYVTHFEKGRIVDLIFPGEVRRIGTIERVAPQARSDTMNPQVIDDSIVLVDIGPAGKVWPTIPIGSQIRVLPRD